MKELLNSEFIIALILGFVTLFAYLLGQSKGKTKFFENVQNQIIKSQESELHSAEHKMKILVDHQDAINEIERNNTSIKESIRKAVTDEEIHDVIADIITFNNIRAGLQNNSTSNTVLTDNSSTTDSKTK